jgi:hypothetical protein
MFAALSVGIAVQCANMQTGGFDASSLRTDRITLMVTTKLLDGHAPVLVEVLTGRRIELPIGWAYQTAVQIRRAVLQLPKTPIIAWLSLLLGII